MSVIATAVKHLLAAGVTGDALVAAIAEMEAAQPAKVDKAAENKRAYDREYRRRNPRSRTKSYEQNDPSSNDIYSNLQPEPNGAKAPSSPLADRVVSAWNEGPGKAGATKARPLDTGRRKLLSLRAREHGEEAVFEAIRNLAGSPFHCGQNDRNWKATTGWLLKAENFLKALELTPEAANDRRPLSTAEQIAALKVKAEGFDGWNDDRAAECRAEINRLRATGPPGHPIGASVERAMAGLGRA